MDLDITECVTLSAKSSPIGGCTWSWTLLNVLLSVLKNSPTGKRLRTLLNVLLSVLKAIELAGAAFDITEYVTFSAKKK